MITVVELIDCAFLVCLRSLWFVVAAGNVEGRVNTCVQVLEDRLDSVCSGEDETSIL